MGKAQSKDIRDSMHFEAMPIKKSVSGAVVRKEIERHMDNFGFTRIMWYLTKRYRFQLSFIVNIVLLGLPVFRFVHQFFV